MVAGFFDMRIGRKMLLGYVVVILLPSVFFIGSYHAQMQNQLHGEYHLNMQRSLQQSSAGFKEKLKMAEGYGSLFQNNKAVIDYLVGGYRTESQEINAFLEEINPLFSYVYAVNRDVRDVCIYTYQKPLVPLPKQIIYVDESPEAIADMPIDGSWHIEAMQPSGVLRFEKPIYSFQYRRKRAYFSLDLELMPVLSIFAAGDPNMRLFLLFDGAYYALDSDHLLPPESFADGFGDAYLALLNQAEQPPSSVVGEYLCNSFPLDNIGATIVALTPKSAITDTGKLYLMAIQFVALLIALSVLYYVIISSVTRRLVRFTKHLGRVNLYSLSEYDSPEEHDEIGFLIQTYNDMISRMQTLVKDLNLAELKEKEAAFHALQAQIKPHFLFNALETLRMIAEEKNEIQLADMLYILGNFTRYSLKTRSDGTLGDEIEHVRHYLTLCEAHMEERLIYSIKADDEAKLVGCPSFVLQPLVENCIHHAPKDPISPLCISLCAKAMPDGIHITIRDDGIGIGADRLALIRRIISGQLSGDLLPRKGNSIGLDNIGERLRSHYGERATFAIHSEPGVGTTCEITIDR